MFRIPRSATERSDTLYPRKPLMAPIGPPTHNVPCDPGTSLRLKAIARELGPTWTLTRVEAVAARLMAKHFKIEEAVEAAVASYQAGERKRRRLDLEVEPRHVEAIKRLDSGRGAA